MLRFNRAPSYEPDYNGSDSESPVIKQELEGKMAAIAALGITGYKFERGTANLLPATSEPHVYSEPVDPALEAPAEVPESTK